MSTVEENKEPQQPAEMDLANTPLKNAESDGKRVRTEEAGSPVDEVGDESPPKKTKEPASSATVEKITQEIAVLSDKLFDKEDGQPCMIFSFGYIDSHMTRGLNVKPGSEPCVPVPKAWAIEEPLNKLMNSDPALKPMFTQPFFAKSFKLYMEATPCSYFFKGVEQSEQEFSRDIPAGSTVLHFIDAMYDIFADAKVHPQETMMIFALEVIDDNVHIQYGR